MPKRFTDTDKWNAAGFRKLSPKIKCAWFYLCDKCDHAGVWKIDMEALSFYVGEKVDLKDITSHFKTEVIHNSKLILRSFIDFQYGELNPDNRVHKSVLRILEDLREGASKDLARPSLGLKDKDKDKDKEMDKDKDQDKEQDSKISESFKIKQAFCLAYREAYQSEYPWDAKNFGQAKELIKAHGFRQAMVFASEYPKLKDPWLAQNGHRFDLLRQNVPKLSLQLLNPVKAALNVAEAKVHQNHSVGSATQLLEIKKVMDENEEQRRLRLLGSEVLKQIQDNP